MKDLIKKIPVLPVALAIFAYYGFEYYQFLNSSGSSLIKKRETIAKLKIQNAEYQKNLKQVEDFAQQLEVKKGEVKRLAAQFDEIKKYFPDGVDSSQFVRWMIDEAKNSSLELSSVKPIGKALQEVNYSVQVFEVKARGKYHAYLKFFEILSNAERAVDVDFIDVKPRNFGRGTVSGDSPELEGMFKVRMLYHVEGRRSS